MQNSQTNTIWYVKRLVIVLLLVILSFIIPLIILGGVRETNLSISPPLVGAVAQAIGVGDSNTISVYGKDFTLTDTQYFDNKNWVIVKIHSLKNNGDAYAILTKKDNIFVVVLGPGTIFDSSYAKSLPAEVVNYLQDKGLYYESQ